MIIIFVFFCLGHTSEKRESHFTFQSDITYLFTKKEQTQAQFSLQKLHIDDFVVNFIG